MAWAKLVAKAKVSGELISVGTGKAAGGMRVGDFKGGCVGGEKMEVLVVA